MGVANLLPVRLLAPIEGLQVSMQDGLQAFDFLDGVEDELGAACCQKDQSRHRDAQGYPYRGQMIVAQANGIGPVGYFLGLLAVVLGRLDEADEHFAFAAELQERTGARGLLVQTRLGWARLLLQRGEPGDGERARRLAAAAAELAEDLDIPVFAEQALDLLAMNPTAS